MESLIELNHIYKIYRMGDEEVRANNDISLHISRGEFVAIVGKSGSGKSTLMNIIGALDVPTSGDYFLGGEDVSQMSDDQLAKIRNKMIGFIFQQYNLLPKLNLLENVELPLLYAGVLASERRERAMGALEKVGLVQKWKNMPNQLSGGQQQRVALARAIVTEPKVLLLDEPLSAIDAKLRRNLQVEIRRIQQDFGMTTIFVTHDQDEAMVMSDVIHLFHNGLIEQSGTPTEMYTQPVSKFAASFIGNYNILSAADFQKASGEAVDCADVAIRPEIVRINLEVADESKRFHMEGEVVNSLSHGNLMRYTILCNGVEINADIMFEKSHLLEIGQKVRLSIRKTNVILLNS